MNIQEKADATVMLGAIESKTGSAGFVIDMNGKIGYESMMAMASTLIHVIANAEKQDVKDILMDMIELVDHTTTKSFDTRTTTKDDIVNMSEDSIVDKEL